MQTFLPYPDFSHSAAVLDNKRLQKQIVECKQIYLALTEPDYGWKNHPAVKMWAGYEECLCQYAVYCILEWHKRRGYAHSLIFFFINRMGCIRTFEYPKWLGLESFHLSHRSNLLRKDYDYYHPLFGDISPDIPYFWPTKEGY